MQKLTWNFGVMCLLCAGVVFGNHAGAQVRISYRTQNPGMVSLGVYDMRGRLVRVLQSGKRERAGAHEVTWDGRDDTGAPSPPGTYVLKGLCANVSQQYLLTCGSGKPPYFTADGKGGWGAIHGNPMAADVDEDGFVYLVWYEEEGPGAILKFNPDGAEHNFLLWRQHKKWSWGKGIDIEVDDKYVYVLLSCIPTAGARWGKEKTSGFIRLRKDNGDFVFEDVRHIVTPVGRKYSLDELHPRWMRTYRFSPHQPLLYWSRPVEWADASKRTAPGAIRYFANARAIAAHNGKVYISLYLEDKISVYDRESARKVGEIEGVQKPQGLAFDRDGNLLVVSGRKVLKFTGGRWNVFIGTGLDAPFSIDTDAQGRVFISDLGRAMQIKVYSRNGDLLREIGRRGGRRYWGRWAVEKSSLLYPTHLGVSHDGRSVFVGEDATPKRVVEFHDGKFRREWIGPIHGGCMGMPCADPQVPEHIYHFAGSGFVRFVVDYEKKTWRLDAYWTGFNMSKCGYHPRLGPCKWNLLCQSYGRDLFVRHYRGHTFLIATTPVCIYRLDGDMLSPSAVVSCAWDGKYIERVAMSWKGIKLPPGTRKYLYTWRDANGNWEAEPDEVDFSCSADAIQAIERTGYVAAHYSYIFVDDDMNLYIHDYRRCWARPSGDRDLGTATLWKLPCLGLDQRGNPIYSWKKVIPLLKGRTALTGEQLNIGMKELPLGRLNGTDDKRPVKLGPQACYLDREGNFYFVYHTMGVSDVGLGWAASNLVARVARFDADGRIRWIVGQKARSVAKPGQMYVPHSVAGVEKGCVFVVDRNAQLRAFDKETGLYVGSFLKDLYIGCIPDENSLWSGQEWTSSQVFTHPRNGNTYLIAGDFNGPRVYLLKGLDEIERFETQFRLESSRAGAKPGTSTGALAEETLKKRLVGSEQMVLIPPAPRAVKIDGDLSEWNKGYPSGPVATDPANGEILRTRSGVFYLMYDPHNLYIAAEVMSPYPLYNPGMPDSWWWYDSVQVRFETRRGFYGDIGMYRDVRSGECRVYRSWGGWGKPQVGKVENLPTARLAMVPMRNARGYIMEAAVPWREIDPQFKPQPGTRFSCTLQLNWTGPGRRSGRESVYTSQLMWNGSYRPGSYGPALLLPKVREGMVERKTVLIFCAPPDIKLDGELSDWNLTGSAETVLDPDEPLFRAKTFLAWDDDFLYVAFVVDDDSPMRNAGSDIVTCFKTGDTAELFLCTDPRASPERREPTRADWRIVLTRLRNERPVVIAFHPVARGQPRYFTHPTAGWRTRLDEVKILKGAKVVFKEWKDGRGYVAEARIPWRELGAFRPQHNLRIPFNIAVNFSDRAGRRNVAKVHWNGPSFMCNDVALELRLNTWAWGWAQFTRADWRTFTLTEPSLQKNAVRK